LSDEIVLEFQGLDALMFTLMKLVADVPKEAAGALYEVAEEVMTDSKENYCPVAPIQGGTLKNSGFVEAPDLRVGDISVKIGYGGQAEDYAVVQHERLDYRHTTGEAKYLEKPVMKAQSDLDQRVGDRLKERLGL
jgi:hypothetical protein